jgi:hypothetical protein
MPTFDLQRSLEEQLMGLEGQTRRSYKDIFGAEFDRLLQHHFKEFFEGVSHSVPRNKTLWDYLLEDE